MPEWKQSQTVRDEYDELIRQAYDAWGRGEPNGELKAKAREKSVLAQKLRLEAGEAARRCAADRLDVDQYLKELDSAVDSGISYKEFEACRNTPNPNFMLPKEIESLKALGIVWEAVKPSPGQLMKVPRALATIKDALDKRKAVDAYYADYFDRVRRFEGKPFEAVQEIEDTLDELGASIEMNRESIDSARSTFESRGLSGTPAEGEIVSEKQEGIRCWRKRRTRLLKTRRQLVKAINETYPGGLEEYRRMEKKVHPTRQQ